MQYAQEGHSPVNSTTQASYASSPSAHGHAPARVRAHTTTRAQEAELRHNIRRLAHHPAIVIWDGCNECTVIIGTDTGIYATFVMTVPPRRAARTSAPGLTYRGGLRRQAAACD